MRLLFLSSFYPPYDRGGLDQLCHEVVTSLQQRGHIVHVLTSRYGIQDRVEHDETAIRSLYLQAGINYYRMSAFFGQRRTQEQANARELRQAIERLAPDVIVIWNMWNLSRNLPYWAEQWMPGRVAYYIAATWPTDPDIHLEYWQLSARRRLSEWVKRPMRALALAQLRSEGYPPRLRFEHAMCISQFVYDTCVQARQLPATAGVLYAGIDPEPFLTHARGFDVLPANRLRLVYTGALIAMKGVHTAIEALNLLKQRGYAESVELTIIGSGHPAYETQLRSMVAQYQLEDRVCFAGPVTRAKIPECLSRFDVFLFTSIGPEALGRSDMEAMAAGLLVIGAEAGGQVEILKNRQNALTFRAGDAAGLADQIERVLADPALRVELARRGQSTVLERFSLRRTIDDLESWLESLL